MNALAVREELSDRQRSTLVTVACAHSKGNVAPTLLEKLGWLYRQKVASGVVDYSIPVDYFQHLERGVLLDSGLLRINDFKETRLSTTGMALASELSEVVVWEKPMSITLQSVIRDARQAIANIHIPMLNKFWWRNLMWRLRHWWAETHPEPRPIIDMGELTPVKLWTAEDERRAGEMWVESKFGAFWLCPSGVEKGIEHLNTLEKLKKKHGKKCIDAAFAVGEFAKQCAALPAPQPKLPAPSTSDTIIFNTVTNKSYINGVELMGKGGVGKTYAVATGGAFIVVDGDHVEAARTAIELADEQATKAVKALNRRKPKQFVIIDDFCKTFNELEMPKNMTPEQLGNMTRVMMDIETKKKMFEDQMMVQKINPSKPKSPRPSKK